MDDWTRWRGEGRGELVDLPGSARSERRSRSGPCPAFGAAMRVLREMSWRVVFEASAPAPAPPPTLGPRRRRYRVVVGNALRKLIVGVLGIKMVAYDGSIL